jgi:signal transduction histidine kinase
VTVELAQVVAAWPVGVSLAAAVLAQGLQSGRRRSALNEAVHELRRPLQTLALVTPSAPGREASALQGSVEMAARALERLECEINGEATTVRRRPLSARALLQSAVERWQRRAALAGSSLTMRCEGEATVDGDRNELAQALDNLIANAIEHGGPEIALVARAEGGRLRLSVLDSGRAGPPGAGRVSPRGPIARLAGRQRRGHGLRVVRRAAGAHGGSFRLRSCGRGTEAILELPLAGGGA